MAVVRFAACFVCEAPADLDYTHGEGEGPQQRTHRTSVCHGGFLESAEQYFGEHNPGVLKVRHKTRASLASHAR